MKKITFIILISTFIISCKNETKPQKELNNENIQLGWLEEWFSAWELMSKEVLELPKTTPPEMFFFDEKYIYTTSEISAPFGKSFNGPKLLGEKLPWKRQLHNDTLTIPNGQRIPIQLMTFAAPSEKKNVEAFFVMAAPIFWKNTGIESNEVSLDKLLTGVFLHEFSHTRQMKGIGSQITEIENNHTFKYEISDDIIQDYFINDSLYIKEYNKEIDLLYAASNAKTKEELHNLTKQGIGLFKERQKKYLIPENKVLVEMDNVFLTMEGLGQYMIVSWLTHPKGGNYPLNIAVKATRRGGKWWSQDEGLALFLVLNKMKKPNWKIMFSNDPIDIVTLIEEENTIANTMHN
jgi:hypothetical protein